MTAPAPAQTAVDGAYSLAAATTARTVQLAIRAQLLSEVAKLWPLLDPKRLDQTWPGWLAAMSSLVKSYHGQSATAAAAFYRAARATATGEATPGGLVKLASPPDAQWMTRALGYSGPGMLSRDTARPGTALTTTLGTSARIALDGGRTTIANTVHADDKAVGWYRVTDGHPCAFCSLLASRGIAYKSQKSAAFQSHNDCGCTSAPAFTHDQQLPAISREAAEVYRNRGSGDALVAFRKAWAEHQNNAEGGVTA